MKLNTSLKLSFLLKKNSAFIWDSKRYEFSKIQEINSVPLNLLLAIDRQKKILLDNTKNFAKSNIVNNALLWGSRGSGKSTLIKSIYGELRSKFLNLKLKFEISEIFFLSIE